MIDSITHSQVYWPAQIYWAALITKVAGNLSAVQNIAGEAALTAAKAVTGDALFPANIAGWPVLFAAVNATWSVIWPANGKPNSILIDAVSAADGSINRSAGCRAVESITRKVLLSAVNSTSELGEIAYKISEIVTLHWLLQNGASDFKAVYNRLNHDLMIEFWKEKARYYLTQKELLGNPYIDDLKSFLTKLEGIL